MFEVVSVEEAAGGGGNQSALGGYTLPAIGIVAAAAAVIIILALRSRERKRPGLLLCLERQAQRVSAPVVPGSIQSMVKKFAMLDVSVGSEKSVRVSHSPPS